MLRPKKLNSRRPLSRTLSASGAPSKQGRSGRPNCAQLICKIAINMTAPGFRARKLRQLAVAASKLIDFLEAEMEWTASELAEIARAEGVEGELKKLLK